MVDEAADALQQKGVQIQEVFEKYVAGGFRLYLNTFLLFNT